MGAKAVNGARPYDNNFEMNGVPVDDNIAIGYGSALGAGDVTAGIPVPNPDAILEFKVQTGQYDASFGRDAGANVNIITKTGSNSIHGSVFEFLRNNDLNANEYFRKLAGQPRGVLKQNQFGFALGAPIRKNKLFVFGSYQGTRQRNGVSTSCQASLTSAPLTNDRSAAGLGAVFGGKTGAFGGVAIASNGSNISPIALNLFQLKLANGQYLIPTPQTVVNGSGFSVYSQACQYNEDQFIADAQYIYSQRSTFSFKYFQSNNNQTITFGNSNVPGILSPSTQGFRTVTLTNSFILSPHWINELTLGYNYINASQPNGQSFQFPLLGSQYPSSWATFSELLVLGSYAVEPQTASTAIQPSYTVADSLVYSRGAHTIRIGGEYTHVTADVGGFSLGDGTLIFASTPDLLLGLPGCALGSYPTSCNAASPGATNGSPISNVYQDYGGVLQYARKLRAWDGDLYAQYDYKANNRLNLNIGARMDHLGTFSDVLGRISTINFAQLNANPPATGSLNGFVVSKNYPGTVPPGVAQTNHNYAINGDNQYGFVPRVGFEWQVLPNSTRLVLRGGYGVFFSTPTGTSIITGGIGPPWEVNEGQIGSSNTSISLLNPFGPGPFPMQSDLPVFSPYSPTTLDGQQYQNPNFRPGYAQEFSLNTQTDLGGNYLLEVGYVGSLGTHLGQTILPNQSYQASAANPVRGITTNTFANVNQRAKILGFSPAGLIEGNTEGASSYNGLQTSLTKRFSHGLQFLASYTFSKSLDTEGVNIVSASQGVNGGGAIGDMSNPGRRYGLTNLNRPNRFIFSYTYELPVLKGNSDALRKLMNGWQVSGVTAIQSGTALTVTGTNSTNVYGITADFAPLSSSCSGFVTPGAVKNKLNNYFNTSCFSLSSKAAPVYPVVGSDGVATGFGNSGVGIARGPGQDNWDAALSKKTMFKAMGKEANVEFRSEFFNLFNTPQFANPGTGLSTSTTFGKITSTSVNPRIVQFALKLNF